MQGAQSPCGLFFAALARSHNRPPQQAGIIPLIDVVSGRVFHGIHRKTCDCPDRLISRHMLSIYRPEQRDIPTISSCALSTQVPVCQSCPRCRPRPHQRQTGGWGRGFSAAESAVIRGHQVAHVAAGGGTQSGTPPAKTRRHVRNWGGTTSGADSPRGAMRPGRLAIAFLAWVGATCAPYDHALACLDHAPRPAQITSPLWSFRLRAAIRSGDRENRIDSLCRCASRVPPRRSFHAVQTTAVDFTDAG